MRRISIAATASLCLLLSPLFAHAGAGGKKTFFFTTVPVDCSKSTPTTSPFGQCAAGTRAAPVVSQVGVPKPAASAVAAGSKAASTGKPVPAPTAGYTKCAELGQLCKLTEASVVIWGSGTRFTTGKVVDRNPNGAGNIAELDLDATQIGASTGLLAHVVEVLRLNTVGGVAPAGTCDPRATPTVNVPYRADYVFVNGQATAG